MSREFGYGSTFFHQKIADAGDDCRSGSDPLTQAWGKVIDALRDVAWSISSVEAGDAGASCAGGRRRARVGAMHVPEHLEDLARKASSAAEFLDAARRVNTVFFDQVATALPQRHGSSILMLPAVVIQYRVHERTDDANTEWVYSETIRAQMDGRIQMAGSVYQQLEAAHVTMQPIRRPYGL